MRQVNLALVYYLRRRQIFILFSPNGQVELSLLLTFEADWNQGGIGMMTKLKVKIR